MLPDTSNVNHSVKQQYINGHYCYAHKIGIMTNGNGIIRDISFFDDDFKAAHPEVVSKKSDNPDFDKEISDSHSLKPVLSDFFNKLPNLSYSTFLGDAAFDSYDNYTMLKDDFSFSRVCIERTIFTLKDCFGLNSLKTHNTLTIKADVFLAGITQLIGVVLAKELHQLKLFKSVRKLIRKIS